MIQHRCPICAFPVPLLFSFDREYARCRSCRMLQTKYRYDRSMYDRSYAENYVAYEKGDLNTPLQLFRLGLISRWLRVGQRILDIGCGVGAFLKFAQLHYNCIGYEPNSEVLSLSSDLPPIFTILNGNIQQRVSCITLFDVLEHIEEPLEFLEALSSYLLDDGFIVVTTPNLGVIPWNYDDQVRNWKHYKPKEHLFLYTEVALESLLCKAGFRKLHFGTEESDIRPGNSDGGIMTFVARKVQ